MVVVMAPDATDEQIDHVVERVESVGGEAFVSRGVVRTIIGLVGDIDSFHGLNLRSLPGVVHTNAPGRWARGGGVRTRLYACSGTPGEVAKT